MPIRDFTREHGVLGSFHDDRLFDELNELERLIRQEADWQERHTRRRSWWWFVVPAVSSWGIA